MTDEQRTDEQGTDGGDPVSEALRRLAEDQSETPRERRPARRKEASERLARVAREAPDSLAADLPRLAALLRREIDRPDPEGTDRPDAARAVRRGLLRAMALVYADAPGRADEFEGYETFVRAVGADLDEATLREVSRALFRAAEVRPGPLASNREVLESLLGVADATVRAWTAGAVGRVAPSHPAAAAECVDALGALLQGHDAVQHNAVEALGAIALERPGEVTSVADDLRPLLDHEDPAIQHNVAKILGRLAAEDPDSVAPAAERLATLREHDDPAVRRVAAATLARLAEASEHTA